MTAVIYARYSSDNQREESIEGQIRECTAYAEKNGITIVKHYIDRAISAKTDNRPEFQQMIKDSDKKLFDKAEDDYLLTTKLFCGYCGALMFGESGTSRTGEVHRYYKCATAKKHKGCKKKTVRKQWLEDLVVNQTMQLVRDDAAMESIIAKVMELQDRENTNLPLYEKQLRDAESGIQNMLNAIQAGILTSSTKERLEQLEETKRELEARIAEEKLAKPKVTEEFIRFWLLRLRKLDMSLKDQRQALVDTFINAIYLYDDKVLITFNYKEGTQTITFEEAAQAASKGNGSDLDCIPAPENAVKSKDFMAFLFCKPWVHGFCTVFARSVLSMSDYVGRCIALQSVPFFASGEQCQAQFCLHFRVGILEQFQKSRHGDGGFACGGYSLRAGGVGLGIEAAFKLLAQLHTGGLLDMSVGVHQHIRTGVTSGPLHRLNVTAGDHQLVGGTGVTQPMKDDTGELWVCVLPPPLPAAHPPASGAPPDAGWGPPCCPVLPASPPPPRCCALGWSFWALPPGRGF